MITQNATTPEKGQLNFRHLFVITYGRSGSTLLQGLLNSIDGMLIRGENNNVVVNLFQAHAALSLTKKKFIKDTRAPTAAWFGAGQIDGGPRW